MCQSFGEMAFRELPEHIPLLIELISSELNVAALHDLRKSGIDRATIGTSYLHFGSDHHVLASTASHQLSRIKRSKTDKANLGMETPATPRIYRRASI